MAKQRNQPAPPKTGTDYRVREGHIEADVTPERWVEVEGPVAQVGDWIFLSQLLLAGLGMLVCAIVAFGIVPRFQPVRKIQTDAVLLPTDAESKIVQGNLDVAERMCLDGQPGWARQLLAETAGISEYAEQAIKGRQSLPTSCKPDFSVIDFARRHR